MGSCALGHSSVRAFPLSRRAGLVNGLVHVLQSKHGEDANLFWRDTAKELLRQLTAVGVEMERAQEEVRDLFYRVLAEMQADRAKAQG